MVAVTRTSHTILPDPSRVLAMPFWPGEANFGAIQGWNAASVYQRAIAVIGAEIDGG